MRHSQLVLQVLVYLLVVQKCFPAVAWAHQEDLYGWVGRQNRLPEKLACLDQEQMPGAAAEAGMSYLQQLQIEMLLPPKQAAADCSCLAAQQVGHWEQQLLQMQMLLPQSWRGFDWLQAQMSQMGWVGSRTAQLWLEWGAEGHPQACLGPEKGPERLQLLQAAAVQEVGPTLLWVGPAAASGLPGPA